MPRTPRLNDAQVEAELLSAPAWEREGDALRRTWQLGSFAEAMAFANRVAALAEAQDHHPDILVQYRRVTLTLSTHDSGGLTELDFRLARAIEK